MKYIVSVSGGLGSAESLKRAIEKFGKANVVAVFADVKGTGEHAWLGMPTISKLLHERFGGESRELYRFIWQLSHHFDIPIERLESQETVWDVWYRRKAMQIVVGVKRFCPASEELKRAPIAKWIKAQGFKEGEYTLVLGMGWDEEHRLKNAKHYWREAMGYDVPIISLNAEKPYASNEATMLYFMKLEDNEVQVSSSYKQGLEHDNCNGICSQAGQGHYAIVYQNRREAYLYAAWMERQLGRAINKPYTILKVSEDGVTRRMSLYEFIERIEADNYPKADLQACACMTNIPQLEDYVEAKLQIPTQISLFGEAA
jgi:hypothetical protein